MRWSALYPLLTGCVSPQFGGQEGSEFTEADTDIDTDIDTDTDTDTDSDTDTDTDTDYKPGLGLYYGYSRTFDVDLSDKTGAGFEDFFYYEPSIYKAEICETRRAGIAKPSTYTCPGCDFALDLEFTGASYLSSLTLTPGVDGCAFAGLVFDKDGNLLDADGNLDPGVVVEGIGFASTYGSYTDVVVYYDQVAGAWYPLADGTFEGGVWSYTYTQPDWYLYVYY